MFKKKYMKNSLIVVLLAMVLAITGCTATELDVAADTGEIPEFSGQAYVEINDNIPDFDEEDLTTESFESYSDLDKLGRCGVAMANVSYDTMPKAKRGAIGQVKPSGWHTVRYDDLINDKYLYNRCHLIGFQLTGENANEENLITGTRYMNVEGMLPFEDEIADYVHQTGNHVLYRVTPIFEGNNLVASGVQMEAMSVEDNGEGVCFNVYVYNCQPDIEIDYATGESWRADGSKKVVTSGDEVSDEVKTYICNTNSKKYHLEDCSGLSNMSEKNKKVYQGKEQSLLDNGYTPCGTCKP